MSTRDALIAALDQYFQDIGMPAEKLADVTEARVHAIFDVLFPELVRARGDAGCPSTWIGPRQDAMEAAWDRAPAATHPPTAEQLEKRERSMVEVRAGQSVEVPTAPAEAPAPQWRSADYKQACEDFAAWLRQLVAAKSDAAARDAIEFVLRRFTDGEQSPWRISGLARAEAATPGGPAHVVLWDAINAYAEACGGDTSKHISVARMAAVAAVENALRVYVGRPR